jgi:hypothetical protein
LEEAGDRLELAVQRPIAASTGAIRYNGAQNSNSKEPSMGWRDWLGLPPNRHDFARRLIQIAENRGSTGWSYDSEEAMLCRGENGQRVRVNLVNLFGEYCQAKLVQRPGLMQKYLTMMLDQGREIPKLWGMAAKGILPGVRSRYGTRSIEIETRDTAEQFPPVVSWPLIDDLTIVLLYDFGPYMSQVSYEKAEVWGQSLDAIRERALQNLSALQRPQWENLNDGVFQIRSAVAYEETFFLIDEVIRALNFRDSPVIAVPNRGVLLAADAGDLQAVRTLIARARQSLHEAPWPLSGTLITRKAEGWKRHEPRAELVSTARALETLSLAHTYRDQGLALQKHADRTGDNVYVATFSMVAPNEDPDAIFSWCSWAQDVATLLPRTDRVGFSKASTGSAREALLVPWADAERICGSLLKRTDEDPPRYRVDHFPNEEQWQQLKTLGTRLA